MTIPWTDRGRAAVTLVEIIVATALGVIITAMTWEVFLSAKSTSARATARVALHQASASLQDAFERDFGTMAPALALFVRSTPTVSGSTRQDAIEIVFMRSTAPLDKQASSSTYDRYLADHHWVRWLFTRTRTEAAGVWTTTAATLKRSTSTPIRSWQTNAALTTAPSVRDPLGGALRGNYNGTSWINIPRPLRDASGGVESLDFNRYGLMPNQISANTPIGDIGDLADLAANEQLVSADVRDFLIGWVDAGGNAVTVDGSTAATHNIDGLYMDVVGPDNGRYLDRLQNPRASSPGAALVPASPQYDYRPALSRRPRLMRISFSLVDKPTGVHQAFTLSVATPGLMPPVDRPAN